MRQRSDISDIRFGRLVAVRFVDVVNTNARWLCQCDCGKTKIVHACALKNKATTSCGCYHLEKVTIHGRWKQPEYQAWKKAIDRCTNENCKYFKNYGGRGITVCERWMGHDGLENFISDMGPKPSPKHSIDRINNDGNYEPGNCRWATWKEQERNRQHHVYLEFDGQKKTVGEWAEITGIPYPTIRTRMRKNYPPDKILVPAKPRKRRVKA